MKRLFLTYNLVGLLFITSPVYAESLKIVTTLVELAWAAKEIGGNRVEVVSLLNGKESIHHIDVVPQFITIVSNADIVCFVGLSLEIGWLPKVLAKSGNARVQPGGKGYCDTSEEIEVLETIHTLVNRSMGDVHPEGNPHYNLSPIQMGKAGKAILSALIRADPKNSVYYFQRYQLFVKRMEELFQTIQKKLSPITRKYGDEKIFIEYHKDFTYFFHAYSLMSFGAIETLPGVPPSAGRLVEISIRAKEAGVRLAIASFTAPKRVLSRFNSFSSIPVTYLPTSMRTQGKWNTYDKVQHAIADGILKYVQ